MKGVASPLRLMVATGSSNLSLKVLLFGGGDYNKTIQWSEYRHFAGDVKDYKIDTLAKP